MFEREAALALGRVVRREEDVESFVRVYLFLGIKEEFNTVLIA